MLTRLLMVAVGFCSAAEMAAQCPYSARDAAFVDLGDEGYRLFGFFAASSSPGVGDRWIAMGRAIFLNSNVTLEVVDPEAPHPSAAQLLSELEPQSFPMGALVGPGGRTLVLPVQRPGTTFDRSAGTCLEAVVGSPLRRELRARTGRHLGVAVLVLGEDPAENQRAQRDVHAAVAALSVQHVTSPDDISQPDCELPHVITVPRTERAAERVLLWSLGLPTSDTTRAGVAFVFGRGRRAGQPLVGGDVTTPRVLSWLRDASSPCENAGDAGLTRGPRVPMRTDRSYLAAVAEQVGFDIESPAVHAEIRERIAQSAARAVLAEAAARGIAEDAAAATASADKHSADAAPPQREPGLPTSMRIALLALSGLIVSGVGAGALLWHRSR